METKSSSFKLLTISCSTLARRRAPRRCCVMVVLSLFFTKRSFENDLSTDAVVTGRDKNI